MEKHVFNNGDMIRIFESKKERTSYVLLLDLWSVDWRWGYHL